MLIKIHAKNYSARFNGHLAILILTIAIGSSAAASSISFGAAAGYNAFVFGNFTEYNTDSQGRLAVGGNFAPANNRQFTVASSRAADGVGAYDLVVGGNLTNSYASLGGGDVFVGGNLTWTDPTLPHNVYVSGNFKNTSGGGSVGGSIYYGGLYFSAATLNHISQTTPTVAPIDFVSAKNYLQALSAGLASAASNGAVSNNGYGTYTLTGYSQDTNIFDVTGGSYNNSSFNITAPAGSAVIVNVAGSADSFNGGSINLNGVTSANVIFNFSIATSLSVSSMAFNGSILAPNAAFTGNSGQLNGQLIAQSDGGTMELHDVLFNSANSSGIPISAVSEPASWLMFATGGVMVGAGIHRRSKRGKGDQFPAFGSE